MSDSPQEDKTPKFCPNCGSKVNRKDAKFCSKCGTAFHENSQPSTETESSQSNQDQAEIKPISFTPNNQISSQQTSANQFQTAPFQQRDDRSDYRYTTPSQIRAVQGSIFNQNELRSIGIFIGMVYISHLLRYFFLYNSFPTLIELLVPIPLYVLGVFLIFFLQKNLMRRKGIQPKIESNRFDFSRSLVFSTFFLSLLPSRLIIDKEKSNVPENLQIPQSSQYGMNYQNVSRSEYVGSKVKPYMYLVSNFLILVITIILMFIYFSFADPLVVRAFQLFTAFLGSYVVVELAPIFGRHNKESSEYGRYRTLAVFLIAFIVTVTSLLGELIFNAISYL